MKTHELKILPQYFKAVADGSKTFEIRKNDRGFKVGDNLRLREYSNLIEKDADEYEFELVSGYTGKEITKEVSYILEGGQYGLEEGYCILGLKPTFKSETLKALLDVGLDAKAIQECYERYKWHIDYYKDAIKLKNIDLTGISLDEQWEKKDEEDAEFLEACIDYENRKTEPNKEHMLEEFYDTIQANLGILEKYGISAEEVMQHYPLHEEKIKHRPRIKEE